MNICSALLVPLVMVPVILHAQVPPTIEWQRCLGGSMAEYAYAINCTSNGGYIVTGYTRSMDGDVGGPHHGGFDVWVVKLDANGELEWERCYGGSSSEVGYDIQQTADGGYIVAGHTSSNDGDVSGFHGGFMDIWVFKLDPMGMIQWQRCLGGSAIDFPASILLAPDGGYIVAGYTGSTDGDVSGNPGSQEAWVVKLGQDGSLEWERCYGGPGTDDAWSATLTVDGGFILVGTSNSTTGGANQDYWVVKVDAQSVVEWEWRLGGVAHDHGTTIKQAPDGGYIVAGTSRGDVSCGQHGLLDAWVVKLDANGTPEWDRCFGGSFNDWVCAVQVTSEGNYIFASFSNSTDGDVSGNHGITDGWLLEVSATGDLLWQKCIGGSMAEEMRAMSAIVGSDFAVAGSTESNDGDVSGHHGYGDIWVVKLHGLATGGALEVEDNGAGLEVFPNPTNDVLYIGLDGLEGAGWQLDILDALGRIVHTRAGVGAGQPRVALPTGHLAQGTYCVRLHNGAESHTTRFIKQ